MLTALLEKIRQAANNTECRHCRKPVTESVSFCVSCAGKLGLRENFPLTSAGRFKLYAATLFTPATKSLLYGYKFYGRQNNRPVLADILSTYWQKLPAMEIDPTRVIVTSIPAHLGKAPIVDAVARQFASRFGYRFSSRLLNWQREIQPQHNLHSRRQRIDNVKNSLVLNTQHLYFEPDRIIIVDDLSTTGATMLEAYRAIRNSQTECSVTGLAVSHIPLAFQRASEGYKTSEPE